MLCEYMADFNLKMIKIFFLVVIAMLILAMTSGMNILRSDNFFNWQKVKMEANFLKYKRASSYIQANWISPVKIRKLNITGSEGYLEMDYISQKIEIYKSNYSKFKEESSNFSDYVLLFSEPDITNVSVKKKEPLKEEILFFIDCIKNQV